MTMILITNAVSAGVAVVTCVSVAVAKHRRRRQRVQRIYLTLDGRQVTRDEPL